MTEKRDVVIIGGGPGGYLAALRGAQLGRKITLVERDRMGGTCMNYGCIPTKYLLHQTKLFKDMTSQKTLAGPVDQMRLDWAKVQQGRKSVVDRLVTGLEFLIRKGKVESVSGEGRLGQGKIVSVESQEGMMEFEAENVIVASGSRAANLPFLSIDGQTAVTSTEALEFADIPKSLIIVGAGAIGLEIGSLYLRLGTEVTLLEILPSILPGSDLETVRRLERSLKKQGMTILPQMRIETARVEKDKVILNGTHLVNQAPFEFTAEKILLAAGRKPNTENIFEGSPVLQLDETGFIKVDESLETTVPGVYAVGDVIGGKLLAHKAYRDGVMAMENAAGACRKIEDDIMPAAVFTDPEFATVGLTQEEAEARGEKVQVGVFPLQASGRAHTMESPDGMVKLIADRKDKVIGAHLLAPGASDIIPALTMALAKGMTIQDIASLVYIHPTLSESIGEAALKAKNAALHMLNT